MVHQTARDTTTGAPKPLGARGARMAGTVGAEKAARIGTGRKRDPCRPTRSNKPLPAADRDFIVDRKNQRPETAFYRHVRRFDYFRASAVRALCKARSMPQGRMKHLRLVVGRIYNLIKKEAAYGPNTQHLEDFRAAQKLERSLDRSPDDDPPAQSRFAASRRQSAGREAR